MNYGWIVVLARTGINLMFGVLYAWSIFGANLSSDAHAGRTRLQREMDTLRHPFL